MAVITATLGPITSIAIGTLIMGLGGVRGLVSYGVRGCVSDGLRRCVSGRQGGCMSGWSRGGKRP